MRYLCIMIGGFLGPFAGQSLSVVLPEFAADFGISLRLASLTMTAYMLPFAFMMLVSTYLVRTLSPTRVVRVAYATIACASVVLVLSPVWWAFVAAYIVAGIANAFTAPLLQLILRHITAPDELGKAMGTYAAMQAFGLFSAPLFAGAAVTVASWRWMYVALFAFAVFIVCVGLPAVPPSGAVSEAVRLPPGPVLRAIYTLLAIGAGVVGMGFLISLHVEAVFDVPPLTRGLIVMAGGLTAFLFARPVGGLADTRGPRPLIVGSLLVGACAMVGVGVAPSMVAITLLWGVAVLAAQGVQVGVNMLILASPRGAQILSTIQAFRFFGNALTPILILPLYGVAPLLGFGAAVAFLLVAAGLNAEALRK
ncbi:bicyclomycin/multidrug efflux system [Corynebacterium auris]|nr:bicyclomycin/multidrug efflux system [Corynebacterium auris]